VDPSKRRQLGTRQPTKMSERGSRPRWSQEFDPVTNEVWGSLFKGGEWRFFVKEVDELVLITWRVGVPSHSDRSNLPKQR